AQKMELTMTLEKIKVNSIDPNRAPVIFSRANLSSLPGFDLARGMPDGNSTGLQRVRGNMR
ncbi:MAG: hypothetical protein ACRD36_12295, partial [Candidatus Acidiferrum sp.]